MLVGQRLYNNREPNWDGSGMQNNVEEMNTFYGLPPQPMLFFPPPPAMEFQMQQMKPSSSCKSSKKKALEFCLVCRKSLLSSGKRAEDPRRHVLKSHLRRAMFSCPHCSASSNYDKGHISTHMKRVHPDLGGEIVVKDKSKYEHEIEEWYKLCYGTEFVKRNARRYRVPEPKRSSVERTEGDSDALVPSSSPSPSPPPAPLNFSIERILSTPFKPLTMNEYHSHIFSIYLAGP